MVVEQTSVKLIIMEHTYVHLFNNVQLSDNHTQIKVFVFDKYGGVVCCQFFCLQRYSIANS